MSAVPNVELKDAAQHGNAPDMLVMRGVRLCRHLEEEIQAAKKKNKIGGPGAQNRRKLSDRAQRLKQRGRGPVDYGQTHT
jgi:hypothetical protein